MKEGGGGGGGGGGGHCVYTYKSLGVFVKLW
jgi:hypothetical protein